MTPANQLSPEASRAEIASLKKGGLPAIPAHSGPVAAPAGVGAAPQSRKGSKRKGRPSPLSADPQGATASQQVFMAVIHHSGLPAPMLEYRFHPERLWRMDYAWPASKVALEVDGGIWVNGGHNRGAQMLKTWEKENAAAVLGWRFLRCQPKELCAASIIHIIRQALAA